MKKIISKKVYDLGYDDIPEKADEFFAFWRDKIERVPEEHRDSARIEISTYESYGCGTLDAEVIYTREETDREYEDRMAAANELAGRVRRRELLKLQELKQKYGDV